MEHRLAAGKRAELGEGVFAGPRLAQELTPKGGDLVGAYDGGLRMLGRDR